MSCTQITLPAQLVVKACEAYLERRTARDAEKREKLITKAMKPGLFFRRKGRTREEAITHLQSGDYNSAWHAVAWAGGYWTGKVEDLLDAARAASACGGTIALSTDDTNLIAEFLFKNAGEYL